MSKTVEKNPGAAESTRSRVKLLIFVFGVLLFFVLISVPLTLVVLNTRQQIDGLYTPVALNPGQGQEGAGAGAEAAGKYPGKIIYSTTTFEIFMLNPDGTDRQKIADGRSPVFSPDGQRIAYLADTGKSADRPEGSVPQVAIRSQKLDGSDRQDYCLADGNTRLELTGWSPKGDYIVLRSNATAIYLCQLATHTLTPAKTTTGDAFLVYDWTADQSQVLWEANSSDFNLYFGSPDKAAGLVKLTDSQDRYAQGTPPLYASARISPDGKTVAVAGSTVFFLSVPGQQSPFAGHSFNKNSRPYRLAWSPDSRAVAVGNSTNTSITILDLATGQLSRIAKDTEELVSLDWSRQ
jgi:Tol biopolymer transport system component